jgi:uncharacterized protein
VARVGEIFWEFMVGSMKDDIQAIHFSWEPSLRATVEVLVGDDRTGHDLWHCLRVKLNILNLSKSHSVDVESLVAAAYLHDIGRPLELNGGEPHVIYSLRNSVDILKKCDFPASKIKSVLKCIEFHEHYKFLGHSEFEEDANILLFQDADRLDALGAIGIARVFSFSGAHGLKIWDGNLGFAKWDTSSFSKSAISHIHSKLLKLALTMNTSEGRAEALIRHRTLKDFCREFYREWGLSVSEIDTLLDV